MSDHNKKKWRARELAEVLGNPPYGGPLQKELGELVLELIEEPEAPTLQETGWDYEHEGMIAIDCDGDEVILLEPLGGDTGYRVLWKNSVGRFLVLKQRGDNLRPTGRYADAGALLKNKEEQQ